MVECCNGPQDSMSMLVSEHKGVGVSIAKYAKLMYRKSKSTSGVIRSLVCGGVHGPHRI